MQCVIERQQSLSTSLLIHMQIKTVGWLPGRAEGEVSLLAGDELQYTFSSVPPQLDRIRRSRMSFEQVPIREMALGRSKKIWHESDRGNEELSVAGIDLGLSAIHQLL